MKIGTPRNLEIRDQISTRQSIGADGFNLLMNHVNHTNFCPDYQMDIKQQGIGIGIEFFHEGDWCRAAVALPIDPTPEAYRKAFRLLLLAKENPHHPEITCVAGLHELTGFEMQVRNPSL